MSVIGRLAVESQNPLNNMAAEERVVMIGFQTNEIYHLMKASAQK